MPIMAPTFFLPLFSLFLFCVNDFHEKGLNKISHLRNTSVRWCQRLAYSSSCWVANMAFSHGPGMLTWSGGKNQTQVGSSWKNSLGAFCPQLSFGGNGKNQEAIYYLCCYVNSKKGDGEDKKTRQLTAPCQRQGCQSRHPFPACPVGDVCLRISRNSDLTLTLSIFGTGWKCLIGTCKNISGTEGQRLKFRVKINTQWRKGNSEVKGLIRYEPLS